MDAPPPSPALETAAAPAVGTHVTMLRVAWLSVVLGLVIEFLLVLLKLGFGKSLVAAPIVADLLQKLSWSTIVCVGIAFGKAFAEENVTRTGFNGLLAAPLAFVIAQMVHKAAQDILQLPPSGAGGPSPWLIGAIKGLQYGCFGMAITWVGKQPWGSRVWAYVGTGLAAGAVFGGVLLALTVHTALQTPPALDRGGK